MMSVDASAIVKVSEVSLRYPNGTEALNGVSLDVPKGELVTLLGPSGCGKTSFLKIIAVCFSRHPEKFGSMIASAALPDRTEHLCFRICAHALATVLRNVAFGLELRGLSRASRQAEASDISPRWDWPAANTNILMNFPAGCASEQGWPVRSRSTRKS